MPDRFGKLCFLVSLSIGQPDKHTQTYTYLDFLTRLTFLNCALFPEKVQVVLLYFAFFPKASQNVLCLSSCFKMSTEECSGPL